MKNRVVVIENNQKMEYDVLFNVTDEKNNAKYVVYTDNSIDKEGNAIVYLGKYDKDKIIPLDSNKEKEMLTNIVKIVGEEVCINEG
jgi:hypothetical protein